MLKLDKINNIIHSERLLEVTSRNSFTSDGAPSDAGLYSGIIFGTTSAEISTTFGFISLNAKIIHPAVLDGLQTVNTIFFKIVMGTKSAILKDGMLIEDEAGQNGVGWLLSQWNNLDFKKYRKPKNGEFIEFLNRSEIKDIFIDKWLVIPIMPRMYTTKNGQTIEDEITMLYKELLDLTVAGHNENEFMKQILRSSSKDIQIQQQVYRIHKYFIGLTDSKTGAVRDNLVSKRIDNNARLVANARPDMPFNCAGIPWQVLLNVFDAFIVGFIKSSAPFQDYEVLLNTRPFSVKQYGTHFDYIFRNVDTYTDANPGKREIWIELLVELFEYHPELVVMLKRDPAWDSGSYHTLYPVIIPTNSYHTMVNALLYKPLGGDSFSSEWLVMENSSNKIIGDENGVIKSYSNTNVLKSISRIYDEDLK